MLIVACFSGFAFSSFPFIVITIFSLVLLSRLSINITKVHGSGSCKVDSSKRVSSMEDDSQLQEFSVVTSGLRGMGWDWREWDGMGWNGMEWSGVG